MIHTLSDGERQKVMIAKALAQQTPIVYLDEPTAFLDFPSKVEMMQLLQRLAREQQMTIFLSTHDFELALQIADTLWLMEHNSLSIGTPQQLADSGALARFVERPGITFNPQTLMVKVED
jgi:iron complex transport system ATP-binding protein